MKRLTLLIFRSFFCKRKSMYKTAKDYARENAEDNERIIFWEDND